MALKNLFRYVDGLGTLPDTVMFQLRVEDEYLIMERIDKLKIGLGKQNIDAVYKIKAEDILAFDIVDVAEAKKKSVVGRGIAGNFLFGPVGAIVGGMSAAGQSKVKTTLAVSYLPSNGDDEPRTIIFNVENPSWTGMNKGQAMKMKKAILDIPKSERVLAYLGQTVSDDGSIIL